MKITADVILLPGDRCIVKNYRNGKWEGGTVRKVGITLHGDGSKYVNYEVELHRRSKRTNCMCPEGLSLRLTVSKDIKPEEE